MITIYIPYIHSEHFDFCELKYALRSWEAYFKEDFEVWLIGDKPKWIKNIIHLPHVQITNCEENILQDALSKFKLFLNSFKKESFIRSYDDIYLINDCILNDIQTVRALNHINNNIPSVWRNQKLRTIQVLGSKFSGWLTETHIPEYFETKKMITIFEKYKPIEKMLLTSSLYNIEYTKTIDLIDRTKIKAGFYGFDSWDSWGIYKTLYQIQEICKDKLYLNHNDRGLTDDLKIFIKGKFKQKSRFEI
jgi:hypothetical protein